MKDAKVIRGKAQPSLKFFNAAKNQIQTDIWNELESGMWRNYLVENRLQNDAIGEVKQMEWRPEFPGFYTINEGFRWNFSKNALEEELYVPSVVEDADIHTFLDAVAGFFSQFEHNRIGVHLSGGFDSGLIICLLRHFGIPFVPIGLGSTRFEFRTERRIQEILATYGNDARLLDFDDYPFYANLDKKPKHQVPDSNIKMIDGSTALAEEFARSGCDVVFTGQGGDTLFVDAIRSSSDFRGYNIGNEFTFPWEQDFIYGPRGIKLVSMFSDKGIIDQITNLRVGQREDPLKLWARHFFKEFLPAELSDFSYCADFFGLSADGLQLAKPKIKELFDEAYEYMPIPLFSPKGTKKMMKADVLSFEYETYCDFCTKVSIAAWLHSLFRKDD